MAIYDIRDYMNKVMNASEAKLVEDIYEEPVNEEELEECIEAMENWRSSK